MTIDESPSSSDDALKKTSAPAESTAQPWWATNPAIIAAREAAERWLDGVAQEPVREDNYAAIHNEVLNGSWLRELRAAREDVDRARARYAAAVRGARTVGYSWGEIGRILGVPRQGLHRRFRHED